MYYSEKSTENLRNAIGYVKGEIDLSDPRLENAVSALIEAFENLTKEKYSRDISPL